MDDEQYFRSCAVCDEMTYFHYRQCEHVDDVCYECWHECDDYEPFMDVDECRQCYLMGYVVGRNILRNGEYNET